MRIALIAPPFVPVPPGYYGGTEWVIHELATGLQDSGHEVLLFSTGDSTCPVPLHALFDEALGNRMGQVVPELRQVIDAYDAVQDFDIVHDHTLAGPLYGERFPNLTVVTTVHGVLDDDLVAIYRRVVERAHLVAVSVTQCESIRGLPVAAVVHHGVDAGRFPFRDVRGDCCLFLGRMAPEKGAHRAIAAAKAANVPLVIAGKARSAAERLYFEQEVEPQIRDEDAVFHLGEVSHERKLELLSKARCLLFPIRWPEPFGLVMLEALACGTPVIAFPEGAVPEVVQPGRTGFICADEREMAMAIRRVHEIDRAACRAAVEGHFSSRRMVADHVALYRRLLDRRRNGPRPNPAA